MKRDKATLIIIFFTLIGFIFHLISLTIGFQLQFELDSSIFPDEASFLVYAQNILFGETSSLSTSYHGSLILSSLIALLYSAFGINAFLGRLFSVILGTMLIPLIYYFAKDLFNEKIGIFSAFLILISSVLRFWGVRALSDIPLTFFFTLSIYLFFKGIKKERTIWFFAAGISSTITFLIKFPGFLIFIIILIYFSILIFKSSFRNKRRLFFNFLVIIGIFLGTIFLLLMSQTAITYQPFLQIDRYIQGLLGDYTSFFFYILYSLSLNTLYGIILLLILAVIFIYSLLKLNNKILLLLIWSITYFLFFSLYGPSELYRYLLPAFPALYMLIANFFVSLIDKNRKFFAIKNHWKNKIISIFLIVILTGFMGTEIIVGEYLVVKRANTYEGMYNSSNWLMDNVNNSTNIMAPPDSLSQLEFYTNSMYTYYSLSSANDWTSILADIRDKNINYVVISDLQYPETQTLEICNLIHLYSSLVYNSTDGPFITYIYNTTSLI
ncbi:MAG: phospholipid carrier-dependent glycosyltransferase [Candidatus Lokiarchaeota archaeon]|nr:phospholipid carrier-dependent glycosyltransferase [Candidatus Lokiarchaeota archaeon]